MNKAKFSVLISVLAVLVLIGASCGKEEKQEKEQGLSGPFQGKIAITQATDNKAREYINVVDGSGQTIVFWKDTDKDNYLDSLVVADDQGREKKTIKIQGGVLAEKSGVIPESLDISRDGTKVSFVGTPFVENWWSPNPMPSYPYVLDLATEEARKIDPQELPEEHYPETADAERADAARTALNDDGSKIAFTCDVWGVDFGEIHDPWGVEDMEDMLVVANTDGTGSLRVLELGIHAYHVGIDSQDRVFYAKQKGNKFILSVVNVDGSGKQELGHNLGFYGYIGLSVSKGGRVASVLRDEDVVFVCDDKGNILGKSDIGGPVKITGDGSRVLSYFENYNKKPEEQGLIFYNVDNNFAVEQVLRR